MAFFSKKANGKKAETRSEPAGDPIGRVTPTAATGADSYTGSYTEPIPSTPSDRPASFTPPPVSSAPAANPTTVLPPEELKIRAGQAKMKAAAFGGIVAVLMRAAPYRNTTLAELEGLVVPAVLSGQFSLAEVQSQHNGLMAAVGVVLWARVSPEVDLRLTTNLNTPIKLAPHEWTSGDILWVVDAVGDQRVIGPMLQGLVQSAWQGKSVKIRARDKDGQVRVGTIAFKPAAA
jgi:hemolysin-activating ACP:hemolysin acyltransferase